jgi:hypothetical protein
MAPRDAVLLLGETEDEPRVRVPLLAQAGVRVAFSVRYCAFDEFAPAPG